jgi:hypothetical protein
MLKVVPYIQTIGSEKFREFLTQPFKIDMLAQIFSPIVSLVLFEGWRGKDMNNWYRFTNEEKYVLEFYSNYYIITKEAKSFKANDVVKYQLLLPKTVNDFINDMDRFKVQLYWTEWIDLNFEPKDYLEVNKIEEYFTHLLIRMGKEQDLD